MALSILAINLFYKRTWFAKELGLGVDYFFDDFLPII